MKSRWGESQALLAVPGGSWYVPRAMWKLPSLFGLIFHRFLRPTCLQLGPQLGSQNPPKSLKNRCQDALYFALYFLIDFWSILAPTLDPRISKNRAPAAGRARFYKNRLSKLTSIFDPILDSTLLHFGIQNPPKSFQKSIPRGTKKLINFRIDF